MVGVGRYELIGTFRFLLTDRVERSCNLQKKHSFWKGMLYD